MNTNEKLINLVLHHTGLSQDALAKELNAPPALIAQWMQGNDISEAHSNKMISLLNLGHQPIDSDAIKTMFAMGGVDNYYQWHSYVQSFYDRNRDRLDLDFPLVIDHQFQDNDPSHMEETLELLVKSGMEFPNVFPNELIALINHKELSEDQLGELEETLENSEDGITYELTNALHSIMKSLIVRFTYLNMCQSIMTDDQSELSIEVMSPIDCYLVDYAICIALKETPYGLELDLQGETNRAREMLESYILDANAHLITNNIPIVDHLGNLITDSADELDCKIEAHQLGFREPIGVLLDKNRNIHDLVQESHRQTRMLEAICAHLEIET